jgi:hypothetical protein
MGTKTGNSTKKSTVVKMSPKKAAPVAAPAKATKATKATKAAKPAKSTDSKFIGKTTGQRVQEFQDGLMKANYKAHLTDTELAKAMRNEFPNAVAFTEAHVAGIRSQYNNGRRPSQEGEKPGKPLPKFDEEGNPTNPRARAAKAVKAVAKVGKAVKAAKAKKNAPPVEEEVDEEEVDEEVDETEDEDADEDADEE